MERKWLEVVAIQRKIHVIAVSQIKSSAQSIIIDIHVGVIKP